MILGYLSCNWQTKGARATWINDLEFLKNFCLLLCSALSLTLCVTIVAIRISEGNYHLVSEHPG